jgi:choline dehydrogenase
MTIKDGVRWNTSNAYLRRKGNEKLQVSTGCVVNRILFEGKRAIGVEYFRNGKLQQAFAEKEVILSAGAINSPQILQLSGIGDGKELEMLGIPVI